MKKRLWSILLVACMMLTLLPFGALAADAEVVYSTSSSNTVLMVSCKGEMPNYTAAKPAEWNSLKSTVKTVIVEDGVTAIGNYAFNGFTALESISIPKTVKKIGTNAFAGCTALESATIPADVNSIGDSAFSGCSKLASLTLAATVKTVEQNAFKDTALDSVRYDGVKSDETITRNGIAKTGNEKLTGLTWKATCDDGKHQLETVNASAATCTEEGYTGDRICKVCGYKDVSDANYGKVAPALGHNWGYWTVETAVSDTQDGVEKHVCTRDNSHVERVTIPAGTKFADERATMIDQANKSITVPNKRVNVVWLKWVSEGKPAPDPKTENPFNNIENSPYKTAILWAFEKGHITVPADKAFAPDEMLTAEQVAAIVGNDKLPTAGYEKDYPHSVTYNTDTKTWEIPAPIPSSDANFDYLFSSDKKSVSIVAYKGSAEKVAIPETVSGVPVVAIRDGAFMNNANKDKITEVTIPATVTTIGADAFNGCSKLASVTIPEAVKAIGARAFKGCAALTSVTVPEGVTTIDKEAFANCTKLASATLPKSLKTLAKDAFAGDVALKDVFFQSGEQDWIKLGDLYRGDTDVTVHYAEDASPLTWEVKDGKATVIGCLETASGDLVIPATLDGAPVIAIKDGAFKGCDKLTSVTVPEGVTLIDNSTFSDCSKLEKVTLPKSVTKIENNAFDGTILKDVYYGGTSQDWGKVAIKSAGNDVLKSAAIHYADCVTHDPELKNVKAATCTEKGYSGDKVCKVCGKVVEQGKEVEALGHDWGEWTVTKAATATEKGEETRVCKRDASHVEKRDVDPSAPSENFVDVNTGDFFYDAVVWAVNAKPVVTTGIDALHFNPYDSCTRAQMVTFLWRAAGEPDVAAGTVNPFTDVPANEYFYKAVLWAVQEKITTGTSATTFSPYEQVTRAQTVTFLWRYAKSPVVVASNPFTDVPANEYYTNAVLWAVQEKITNGKTTTTFEPNTVCTRGEIVTFLYRDLGQSK